MATKATHVGFSDESHWNKGRYRSLALVTLNEGDLHQINSQLHRLLGEGQVNEFAWKDLRNDKYRSIAEAFCKYTVDLTNAGKIRVDTLIWDTQDSRHSIQGRDDAENLARMYYHLMRNVIANRWPGAFHWKMHPDQRTDMDWKTLSDCLPSGPSRKVNPLELGRLTVHRIEQPSIESVTSSDQPLIQLADLFAGLGAFSWNEHAAYKRWSSRELGQSDMFSAMFNDASIPELSNSQVHKARTLLYFLASCKRGFAISHKSGKGLRTRNPNVPTNFWFYVPQHEEDKAPLRREKPRSHPTSYHRAG